jgi:predicted DNA-binding transcriptional regulator AlpA
MNSYKSIKETSPEIKEDEKILTEREASEYIRMSRNFLSKDRMNGYRHGHAQGPEFIKLGPRAIRYRKKDLDAWIVKNRIVRELP